MDQTVQRCRELIEAQRPAQHVVINAGKMVLMQDIAGLKDIIRGCAVVNADGQSVVWAGRFLGLKVPERVTGIDLMERLLALAEAEGYPVYFLGATQQILDVFSATVAARFPRLVVAGRRNGYFDDHGEVARQIRESGARLLLAGISSPRKEFLVGENLDAMGPLLAVGVGGSFDIWAGKTKRAPRWMQRAGLEWFYRLLQEPARMWKRYLVGNARFVRLVLRERLRLRPRERAE
ncbi:MAG: WecB/TagA/CpsF family glycosyltransferase [Armatimonadetes bacterium]|nr:WecB/TagA/CpsF family glycosyltransferase [Armatimonadota bacterium]